MREHWDNVYSTRAFDGVSWFERVPEQSLQWIIDTSVPTDAPILDVGGGSSTLVDELGARGFTDISLLDISEEVLRKVGARLAAAHRSVGLIAHDVTTFTPTRTFAVWHDRAVFHFLVDAAARDRYRGVLLQATQRGSHALIATFGPEGPTRCSGLPTARYDAPELAAVLGPELRLVRSAVDVHTTPAGVRQQFLRTHFIRN